MTQTTILLRDAGCMAQRECWLEAGNGTADALAAVFACSSLRLNLGNRTATADEETSCLPSTSHTVGTMYAALAEAPEHGPVCLLIRTLSIVCQSCAERLIV
jgi:hypothetical protein